MNTESNLLDLPVESSVYKRYADAATSVEPALCCPIEYPTKLLEIIPDEILERDYGCGDPSPFVKAGDTVLDLGSGGGKLCYIAAQVVGETGRVIGVDCNEEMLALARKYQSTISERLGFSNVEFRYGMIQNLKLDLSALGKELSQRPVTDPPGWMELRQLEEQLEDDPLVPDSSVDCVVSNCVLNLVRQRDRAQLFDEVFRVLKPGGRAAISDIVSDEDVPEDMQRDGKLWSGCLSGAYREDRFLRAFEDAGFHGIEIVKREADPWQTINGIEFRSVTIVAYKGKGGPCLERNQAVIYRGPFKLVEDDNDHVYYRGERMAVCDKTFKQLQREPYAEFFETVDPLVDVQLEEAALFDCRDSARRSPAETKGAGYSVTASSGDTCCAEGSDCC